jgi:hypothetical protein
MSKPSKNPGKLPTGEKDIGSLKEGPGGSEQPRPLARQLTEVDLDKIAKDFRENLARITKNLEES